jgi:hypothetical protein
MVGFYQCFQTTKDAKWRRQTPAMWKLNGWETNDRKTRGEDMQPTNSEVVAWMETCSWWKLGYKGHFARHTWHFQHSNEICASAYYP